MLSRRIKNVLNDSGVDTSIFKSHSTRHASTSLASIKGVNLVEIRKTAGWSAKSNVFAKFFNRPIVSDHEFANSIFNK